MSSYNRVNGVHSSDNKKLLTDILRNEWKWNISNDDDNNKSSSVVEGIVISDWGGTNDRINGFKAGLDLEMPGPNEFETWPVDTVLNGLKKGLIDMNLIDRDVERVLNVVSKSQKIIQKSQTDPSIQLGITL